MIEENRKFSVRQVDLPLLIAILRSEMYSIRDIGKIAEVSPKTIRGYADGVTPQKRATIEKLMKFAQDNLPGNVVDRAKKV